MRDETEPHLTPTLLLQGYRSGVFPMSESRDDPGVFWVDPRHRGIFPIGGFHISRSLAKVLKRNQFTATANQAFAAVLEGCANREETWINDAIYDLYIKLHNMGAAHSIEVWQDGKLAGGVYGVALGSVFFGESMFSARTDASKVALLYTLDRLETQGFTLFDTQFITEHLATLGAIEVSREEYHEKLEYALTLKCAFGQPGPLEPSDHLLQRRTQTS